MGLAAVQVCRAAGFTSGVGSGPASGVGSGDVPALASVPREDVATAVRFTLEELAILAPGRSVEVRVPPFGATQCVPGPVHRRGTPPSVVETDPATWLAIAVGELAWADAVESGRVRASGERAALGQWLPLDRLSR